MEFLGIGPSELLFIFVIILLVIGPKDIEKTARALGRGLNSLYRSDAYQIIRTASDELRQLPTRLAREANLEDPLAMPPSPPSAAPDNSMRAWVEPLPADNHLPPTPPPSA